MNDVVKEQFKDSWEKPVTMGVLLEYTDSFLLPKMDEMMKANNAMLEYNLKTYIDLSIIQIYSRNSMKLENVMHSSKKK